MNRWAFFALGLIASAGITAALWLAGVPGFFLFLGLPFLFFPFQRGDALHRPACPVCGYTARALDEPYCPRDGTPLDRH